MNPFQSMIPILLDGSKKSFAIGSLPSIGVMLLLLSVNQRSLPGY